MLRIENILVPTDFSPDADAALEAAIEVAKAFGARLHLVSAYKLVVPSTPYDFSYPPSLIGDLKNYTENALAERTRRVQDAGVEVTAEAMDGAPSHVIVHAAEQLGSDLIVMGTRGFTGIKHVLLGSVAERTLRHAPCAVLTVKSQTS